MTESNPFELTVDQRQAFGEYVMRQQKAGRENIGMDELERVIDVIRICIPAEAALAEVGPGNGWQRATELEHHIDVLNEEHRQAVTATIERCAQVADSYRGDRAIMTVADAGSVIAAAIRALISEI